jgi:nucleotide sugar dehydrogenase
MNIAVIGLGKIGLPLAVQFASKGHHVFGVDVNPATVKQVNDGVEPFPGETNLQTLLSSETVRNNLTATLDGSDAVSKSDAVVIVVPLYVNNDGVPDFGWMDEATATVAKGLRPGTLVSYETTLPVGTTRTRFAPALEAGSGLRAGEDFSLVFSPERVFSGRIFTDLRRYPKLVGGIDKASAQRGVAFYEAVLDFDDRPDLDQPNGVWNLGSCEASELAKLAETTYRDVNIGLANQFARFADQHDINIFDVIKACNSQVFSHIHLPGVAVGGHCIPVYPQMYLWNDPDATIVRAARTANKSMPIYAVEQLALALGELPGKRVVVFGAAYRNGVKETAFSGVFDLVAGLRAAGAAVFVHDPLYTDEELSHYGFEAFHLGEAADGAIIQTDHKAYAELQRVDIAGVQAIVDGRNILNQEIKNAIPVLTIGAPCPSSMTTE